MRTPTRSALAIGLSATFVLAACGGGSDDGDDAADTEVVDENAPVTSREGEPQIDSAPEPEAEPEAEPEEAQAEDDAGADEAEPETDADEGTESGGAASGVVTANLVEWAIEAPTDYAAGEITFNATNGGNFPHELVVIAAESYESLPRDGGGAVIEDELPTGALIGRTARISGGGAEDLVVELAPGNYVLVCNLGSGGNSHAGQGQRLDITVTG